MLPAPHPLRNAPYLGRASAPVCLPHPCTRAEADAAGGSAEAAPSKGKAGKGKGGKRSRAASAEAAVEEEAGEAKKVKA